MTVQGSATAGPAAVGAHETGECGEVRQTRWQGLAWIACVVLATGCAQPGPPVFPTASRLPDRERQPDAVAIDLPSRPPPASDDAASDEAVVALRAPLGVDEARATVRSFFQAIVEEDVASLTPLLVPGARVLDLDPTTGSRAATRRSRTQDARSWWSQRFRKHGYDQLEARVVYREADVETYRYEELGSLPPTVADAASALGPAVAASDLVLRVPIVTTTIRSERLLGDELFFWLRREGDRYRILHLAEPFPF